MKLADADNLLPAGGAGPFTPLFCRLTGRKFVMSVGHDAYVDPRTQKNQWTYF
jgi:hypothetical protein